VNVAPAAISTAPSTPPTSTGTETPPGVPVTSPKESSPQHCTPPPSMLQPWEPPSAMPLASTTSGCGDTPFSELGISGAATIRSPQQLIRVVSAIPSVS
jgi:hypothetical protein